MLKRMDSTRTRKERRGERASLGMSLGGDPLKCGLHYERVDKERMQRPDPAKNLLFGDRFPFVPRFQRCLSYYCDEWLILNRSRVKESTYVKYSGSLEKYIKPRLGACSVETVSTVLVEQFCKRSLEEKVSLTAVLIDIDNFKSFNDSYGHACGDMVLTELARIINNCSEENEGISARYGGEEFVLVFQEKGMETTYQIISELQEKINQTSLNYENTPVSVHVSIGISSYPETSDRPEAILNRADAAMYYSKQNGKNRITKDSDEVLAYFRKMSKGTED